jgi:hypothetical protein
MNRREFLGANLVSLIAALCLPFERFEEWLISLFGRPREPFFGLNRAAFPDRLTGLGVTGESFARMLKELYPTTAPDQMFLNPVLFGQVKAAFNG